MPSNLTLGELKDMIGDEELTSPLLRHIVSISQSYLDIHGQRRRLGTISRPILREILLVWIDFYHKYGNDRNDMNSIAERAIANNYSLTTRRLPRQAWGIEGQQEHEILLWNRDECDKLTQIIEIEEGAEIEESAEMRKPKRKGRRKPKRKTKKKRKKKSKKNKSKKNKSKRKRKSKKEKI